MCKNVRKLDFVGLPRLLFGSPLWVQSAHCQVHLWVRRGGSLTSTEGPERNVTEKSHRQSEVPWQCICHIQEMASGVAAEARHMVLRVTEALPHAKFAVTHSSFLTLSLAVTSLLLPDLRMCHSGAAACGHRRCDVMVRACHGRTHFDCRALQLPRITRRSVECRTPETRQVVVSLRGAL